MKTERAARREVSSAEARVTTEARLGAAGATARARRDSVLPTKAGRATTVEAAEAMAAIATWGFCEGFLQGARMAQMAGYDRRFMADSSLSEQLRQSHRGGKMRFAFIGGFGLLSIISDLAGKQDAQIVVSCQCSVRDC